ncbi:MAG: hypothetical protein GX774_07825 [Armatimonadetes bacterium]|jgi:galactose mutarotase-like enzyme|nr:hypothetical protein [Armatimonadota bacterium]
MAQGESCRYRCREMRLPTGEVALSLEDARAGLDALVVPARGAVLESFGVRDGAHGRRELLFPAEHFEQGGGAPVLFPVTGRSLCDGELGSYRHRGTVRPMPLHGFAHSLPWEVVAADADSRSAFVTCALAASEATWAIYPYAFRLALTYRLRDGLLLLEAVVENPGPDPLPFHLGYHPYFRMPVHPEGDRRRCRMRVPSAATWELANLCATGRRLPMAPGTAYDPERALGEETMDRVFADLRPEPDTGRVVCWARDPDAEITVAVEYDPETFPVFVVYTSPAGPYVCLEPWTGLPGGLGDDTPAGQGARRVPPGGRFTSEVAVRVTAGR